MLQILPPIVTPSSRDVPPPTDQNCTYIASNISSYLPEDYTSKSATEESNFVNKRRPVGDPTLNKLTRTTHPLHGPNRRRIDYDTQPLHHEVQDRYPLLENYPTTVGDAQQRQTINGSTRKFDITTKIHMEHDEALISKAHQYLRICGKGLLTQLQAFFVHYSCQYSSKKVTSNSRTKILPNFQVWS